MAYGLILIQRYFASNNIEPHEDRWLHINEYFSEVRDKQTEARVRGDIAKLAYWGLIERKPGNRDDGSSRNGFWRITTVGQQFVKGRTSNSKHKHFYNQDIFDIEDDTQIMIKYGTHSGTSLTMGS